MIKLNKNMLILTASMSALLTGCTIEGEIVDEDRNKQITCTDTRDGEVFSFNSNNVTNFRQGFGVPHSMDIVTDEGEKITINSDMDLYIKCEEDNNV